MSYTDAKRKEIFDEEDLEVLRSEYNLGCQYAQLGQHQTAFDIFERTLKKRLKVLGEDHPDTLETMRSTAVTYEKLGQPENGIPFIKKALDVGSRIGLDVGKLQEWKDNLKWLQYKMANSSTTVPEKLPKSQELLHSQGKWTSSRSRFKLWTKTRRQIGGPPS